MRSSPRVPLGLLLLVAAAPARGADVDVLLAAVAERARFDEPAVATGTLVHRTGDGETRVELQIAGRGPTLRVDAGTDRALVRRGKALVRRDGAPPALGVDVAIAGSNVRFGDLAAVVPALFENPQIVDEGLAGTVVADAPAGALAYALLVVTIDPARALVTQVKYYEHTVNNLVKRDARADFVDVAGRLRPGRITTWDVQGGQTSEIVLAWRAAPALGRAPFTPAGLAEPLAP